MGDARDRSESLESLESLESPGEGAFRFAFHSPNSVE